MNPNTAATETWSDRARALDCRCAATHEVGHALVAMRHVRRLSIRLWGADPGDNPRELRMVHGQIQFLPKKGEFSPLVNSAFGWAGYVGECVGGDQPTEDPLDIWEVARGEYEIMSDTDRARIESLPESQRYHSLGLTSRFNHCN